VSLGSTINRSLQLGRLGVDVLRSRRQPAGPGRDAARRLIAARMGRLRGLPHKIGQILSLGELEAEAPLFSALTDAADPVPARESFDWIAREIGAPLSQVFRRLDERGAAASLGQVHRGELLDGRAVAVKIQYPGVRDSLDADLAALRWLSAPLSAQRSGFDLREYRDEMRRNLLRELDYEHEVAALQRFATRAIDVPGLATPVPVEEWCTPRLITMSWVDGDRIEATRTWPASARHDAALALLRVFLRGCFTWHELHADPHAGNLRFRRDGRQGCLGVIDFGCVKSVNDVESDGLRRLAQDGGSMTSGELLDTYVAIGFNPRLLEPIARRLHAVTGVLFEPFCLQGPYDPREWRLSERLADVLGEDRWNFRFAGPASLLFLIRAFQGLVTYVNALGARIDWRAELLAIPRRAAPPPGLPRDERPAPLTIPGDLTTMAATTLRLRVLRDGEQTVQLSFAATAAGHLEDLIPQELVGSLRDRGIDLRQLADGIVASGYEPRDLFTLEEDGKTVRVWLE
jgi:predicted unusual protein kinase regulating ubiquinone biosynthesis (AarF/ABC1/UbiB family)